MFMTQSEVIDDTLMTVDEFLIPKKIQESISLDTEEALFDLLRKVSLIRGDDIFIDRFPEDPSTTRVTWIRKVDI